MQSCDYVDLHTRSWVQEYGYIAQLTDIHDVGHWKTDILSCDYLDLHTQCWVKRTQENRDIAECAVFFPTRCLGLDLGLN